jgi:hypothetical protein
VELAVRQRAGVGVDDVPLAPAVEPHRVGFPQVLHERLGVGDLRVVRVEHRDVLQSAARPGADDVFFGIGVDLPLPVPIAACGRDDDEFLVRPPGQLDELLDDPRAFEGAAAHDHERAIRRSVLGGRGLLGRERGQQGEEGRKEIDVASHG